MARFERAIKRVKKFGLELKDKTRGRRTEKPHLVGLGKRGQVFVGRVEKINVEGADAVQAKFVPPRLGSQMSPYYDHHTALAFLSAAHQVAVAALKKYNGVRHMDLPTTRIEFNVRKPAPIGNKVLVQVWQVNERENEGKTSKRFKCKFTNPDNSETLYADGAFTVLLSPKEKA